MLADIAYQRPFGISPIMSGLQAPWLIARRGAAPVTQSILPEDYEEKAKSLQDLLEQLQ